MGTLELTRQPAVADASVGSLGVLSDRALAGLVAGGDKRAFEILYQRYQAPLFRYCRAILRNTEDAEEAFQATMMNAYRALASGDGNVALRAWLYQIAHNQCISLIRSRRPSEALNEQELVLAGTVHEQVEIQEQMRQLRSDLESLPPMQRSALVMREMSGLSHNAIGAALSTSPSDARQLVYEARQSLAEFTAGRELSCDDVRHRISDGDRRRLRGRRVRAHMRACPECAAFGDTIAARRTRMAAFLPLLPAALGAEILRGILGPGAAAASASGGATLAPAAASGQGSATAAGGIATAGAASSIPSLVGTAGTIAGFGGLAASTLLRTGSGTAAAGPMSAFSTTAAGGVATAAVVALSVIVTTVLTGGSETALLAANGPPSGGVRVAVSGSGVAGVSGTVPASDLVPISDRELPPGASAGDPAGGPSDTSGPPPAVVEEGGDETTASGDEGDRGGDANRPTTTREVPGGAGASSGGGGTTVTSAAPASAAAPPPILTPAPADAGATPPKGDGKAPPLVEEGKSPPKETGRDWEGKRAKDDPWVRAKHPKAPFGEPCAEAPKAAEELPLLEPDAKGPMTTDDPPALEAEASGGAEPCPPALDEPPDQTQPDELESAPSHDPDCP